MLILVEQSVDMSRVRGKLHGLGLWTEPLCDRQGGLRALRVLEHSAGVSDHCLLDVPGVQSVLRAPSAHPRVDERRGLPVHVGSQTLGAGCPPILMAGPCSVESEQGIHDAAEMVAKVGGRLLRGGVFKPRSSPYSFQGVGEEGLRWLRSAADAHGLAVVTEVLRERDLGAVAEVADLIQIGSRNMQNFALLESVGSAGRPVLLKRGVSAKLQDWLLAGEHLMAAGAKQVIFCERGIPGLDPSTRNVLDLGAVALLKHSLGLPVVVDPSHASGRVDLIPALSRASLAAGADGLLVEAHPRPDQARSDAAQALDAAGLAQVGADLAAAAALRSAQKAGPEASPR